jgi:hypothetical protein
MFCPLCKAECRVGVTWCRGCGVELVPALQPVGGEPIAEDCREAVGK